MRAAQQIIVFGSRPSWVPPGAMGYWNFTTGQAWPRPAASEFVDTRASSKFVTNSAGILVPISSNVLPISDTGMLIEPAATNSLPQSQALATTPWTTAGSQGPPGTTVANNQSGAPDVTSTASSVSPTQQFGNVNQTLTLTPGATYMFSAYIRALSGNTALNMPIYDMQSNGTTLHSIAASSSWQRFPFQYTVPGAATTTAILFQDRNASGWGTFQVWGAEIKPSLSSYVQTTTAAATRAADAITTQRTGIGRVVFMFDDGSTQMISGINTAVPYTLPTNLNRSLIKSIAEYAA